MSETDEQSELKWDDWEYDDRQFLIFDGVPITVKFNTQPVSKINNFKRPVWESEVKNVDTGETLILQMSSRLAGRIKAVANGRPLTELKPVVIAKQGEGFKTDYTVSEVVS